MKHQRLVTFPSSVCIVGCIFAEELQGRQTQTKQKKGAHTHAHPEET